MKIFNQMAFIWVLGALALGSAASCEKQNSAGVTGAALTTNKVDDDQDNKVEEADEAQCVCNNVGDDDHETDEGAKADGSVGDKDDEADEGAKADGGARHHHECECDRHDGGGHHDGDHETDEGAGGTDHTQVNLSGSGSLGK